MLSNSSLQQHQQQQASSSSQSQGGAIGSWGGSTVVPSTGYNNYSSNTIGGGAPPAVVSNLMGNPLIMSGTHNPYAANSYLGGTSTSGGYVGYNSQISSSHPPQHAHNNISSISGNSAQIVSSHSQLIGVIGSSSSINSQMAPSLMNHNNSNISMTSGGHKNNQSTTTVTTTTNGSSAPSGYDQAVKFAAEANAKANLDKDYYEAIKLYGEAISIDGSDHRFYLNRSYCYAQLELYQLAFDDSIQAIALNPQLAKCYFRKGQALAGLKKFRDAEKSFLEVLRLEPDCTETRHELNCLKVAALQSSGYATGIAEWAANKFHTIDDALTNLYSLMNNPTTANIIASGGVNLMSGTTPGGERTNRWDQPTSGYNQYSSGSSSNTKGMIPPGGSGGGSIGQQALQKIRSDNNQQLQSAMIGMAPNISSNSSTTSLNNQKLSDSNQRSAYNSQQVALDSSSSYQSHHQQQQQQLNYNGRDTFGVSLVQQQQQQDGGTLSSSSSAHNHSNGVGGGNGGKMAGISNSIYEQFSSMKLLSPAITPPNSGNNYDSHSSRNLSSLSSGTIGGSSSGKAVGPIGRPVTGNNTSLIGPNHSYNHPIIGSGSEPSISPAVSDSNTDTSGSPSLGGDPNLAHHQNLMMINHSGIPAFGGSMIKTPGSVSSAMINGSGGLSIGVTPIVNHHHTHSNGAKNSSSSGAWGGGGTAFSYSDIVKKKPTAAEVVAANNAANGFTKATTPGDEKQNSSGWSSVVESNGQSNGSWNSSSENGTKMIGQSQSAIASSKRPTNIWGYNGLRVANVSNTASKSTLHSVFSKFGRIKLIERINNKNVDNQLWVFYDNEKSPIEVISKYQSCIIPGISMNSTTGLRFFFAATDDQKDLKFSRPKQPQDNRGECYYWRTTNCFSRESCSLLHIPACKNIDAQVWMKMNRDPAATTTTPPSGSTTAVV